MKYLQIYNRETDVTVGYSNLTIARLEGKKAAATFKRTIHPNLLTLDGIKRMARNCGFKTYVYKDWRANSLGISKKTDPVLVLIKNKKV
ncbi:Uncharacterised protein [uncultured archaeon]|nr:Uncharacterised protein [uncultured archaeon]